MYIHYIYIYIHTMLWHGYKCRNCWSFEVVRVPWCTAFHHRPDMPWCCAAVHVCILWWSLMCFPGAFFVWQWPTYVVTQCVFASNYPDPPKSLEQMVKVLGFLGEKNVQCHLEDLGICSPSTTCFLGLLPGNVWKNHPFCCSWAVWSWQRRCPDWSCLL